MKSCVSVHYVLTKHFVLYAVMFLSDLGALHKNLITFLMSLQCHPTIQQCSCQTFHSLCQFLKLCPIYLLTSLFSSSLDILFDIGCSFPELSWTTSIGLPPS